MKKVTFENSPDRRAQRECFSQSGRALCAEGSIWTLGKVTSAACHI